MRRPLCFILTLILLICSITSCAPKISNTKWASSIGISSAMVLEFGSSFNETVKYYIADQNLYPRTNIVEGTYSYYGKTIGKTKESLIPYMNNKYGISIEMIDDLITGAWIDPDGKHMSVTMKDGQHTFTKVKK